MLIAPTAGFESARRAADRRVRTGETPAEGYTPYVLAAAGGAALFILWLKLSALLGLRDTQPVDFRWGFLAASALLGALLALVAQRLWGWAGAAWLKAKGTEVRPGDLRMVWGASAFPQVLALLLLLPADVLVVGPQAFTAGRLPDPVSSAWAALSLAVGIALALWSWGLLVKGFQVVGRSSFWGALGATLGAAVCLTVLVVALRFGALALMEYLG